MSDLTPRPVPLEQTRERIVEQLCRHYAAENLTDDALEDRLARAYAATTLPALQALVADLPVEAPSSGTAPSSSVALARPENVSPREVLLAIMGGAERKGAWTVPRELVSIAVMGGIHLDFRDARFGPGVTEVRCFAMMGGVEIVIPPGVHVEMNGLPLMGGFAHRSFVDPPTDPNAPVLRIGGVAIMGGVDVTVRHSGESERQARARDRLAQREARRLNGGR